MHIRKNITAEQEKEYMYLMREKATSLHVVENEEYFGILCDAPSVELRHFAYSRNFKITISQNGARRIIVETTEPVCAECLWDMYQDVARFLMLFDGHFLKIHSATFYEGNQETIWSRKLFEAIKIRRLAFYSSADFMFGSYNFSLCPLTVITSELLDKYLEIESEMDLIHHMALYNMADTGIAVDCKCAQLIEVFEPFAELMEKNISGFKKPTPPEKSRGKESQLKHNLIKIIPEFGQDIFSDEVNQDLETIAQIMVNSRNRIAHIQGKVGRAYLDGTESLIYASKLSKLYRRILLEILEISYDLYQTSIINSTSKWYNNPRYHDAYLLFLSQKVNNKRS